MDFLSFDTIAVGVIFLALVRELLVRQRTQHLRGRSGKADNLSAH